MTNHHQGLIPEEVFSLADHQRQDIIAEKLSWLIRDEYLEDITQHRRRMEACLSIKGISIITSTDRY